MSSSTHLTFCFYHTFTQQIASINFCLVNFTDFLWHMLCCHGYDSWQCHYDVTYLNTHCDVTVKFIMNIHRQNWISQLDQLHPWIKDQQNISLLSTVLLKAVMVTRFCFMWEGSHMLQYFMTFKGKIIDNRVFASWSLIYGSNWSDLIKAGPCCQDEFFPWSSICQSFCLDFSMLIRWGRVTHICISEINHHWSRWWLVAW